MLLLFKTLNIINVFGSSASDNRALPLATGDDFRVLWWVDWDISELLRAVLLSLWASRCVGSTVQLKS